MTDAPLTPQPTDLTASDDPHRWLEDVDSDRALHWVRERNAQSQGLLMQRPEYAASREQLLAVFNAQDRIPAITRRGPWLYNLWQDEAHPRGLWRRTTLDQYRLSAPVWHTVLDLDALALAEGENWVWGGATCLGPDYRLALVSLSRGGADAKVVREFDLHTCAFVPGGFTLPEAKSDLTWIDANTVYVGTDVGPGSLTDSGYPRLIKRWHRGTALSDAVTMFEGQRQDVLASVSVDRTPGFERTLFVRALDFYNQQYFLLSHEAAPPGHAPALQPLDVPTDAQVHFWRDSLLLHLRSDLLVGRTRHPSGSLLCADAAAYLRGEREFQALFSPTDTRSLAGYTVTREHLVLNVMDQVASRLEQWHKAPPAPGHTTPPPLTHQAVPAPFPGSLDVTALHDPLLADDPLAHHYLLSYTDFLTPDTLSLASALGGTPEPLKSRVPQFDATGMQAEQRFATSTDGTRVPYFVVWPAGAHSGTSNGTSTNTDGGTHGSVSSGTHRSHPTLLYGYGGFEISLTPWYPSNFGRTWFERGGVLVVANIRGGGEFGPTWHQSATKAHKQRSYDDFLAVAQDLIAQRITTPAQLGIMGGSNGGLLVGAALTQRPDLFNAAVCQVPLLDMRRYHTLLAGASWMAEYGNPDDPAEWEFIQRYSPYHRVHLQAHYPVALFTTSTRDDRVHPAHARKMVARMLALGHTPLYFEAIEGGHGGAADNAQRAHLQALEFAYLWQQLGGG